MELPEFTDPLDIGGAAAGEPTPDTPESSEAGTTTPSVVEPGVGEADDTPAEGATDAVAESPEGEPTTETPASSEETAPEETDNAPQPEPSDAEN
jgi:hypothetical protein